MLKNYKFLVGTAVFLILGIICIRHGKFHFATTRAPLHLYETAIALPEWCMPHVRKLIREPVPGTSAIEIYPIDRFEAWDDTVRSLAIIGGPESNTKANDLSIANILNGCVAKTTVITGEARFNMLVHALQEMRDGGTVVIKFEKDQIRIKEAVPAGSSGLD